MKKECYQIVYDEAALDEFIEWLPELESNEQFYLSLFARKKYNDILKDAGDRTQLKRFTSTKDRLKEKLFQLEIPVGRWKCKGIEAPQDSLVVYIHPNPRNMKKANAYLGKRCWELLRADHFNLHAEAMSAVQKSRSRGIWLDFDIDTKEVEFDTGEMDDFLGEGNYKILETRGGYHLLCEATKVKEHVNKTTSGFNWYNWIKETWPCDQTGDQLIPVVGCTQGGHIPKFLSNTQI